LQFVQRNEQTKEDKKEKEKEKISPIDHEIRFTVNRRTAK